MQSADLRGLKDDIQKKIIACMSEKSNCPVINTTPSDGFISVGDFVSYKGKLGNSHCVSTLKQCLEKDPWIQYHNTDFYLSVHII